jgi:hypothetical protein
LSIQISWQNCDDRQKGNCLNNRFLIGNFLKNLERFSDDFVLRLMLLLLLPYLKGRKICFDFDGASPEKMSTVKQGIFSL